MKIQDACARQIARVGRTLGTSLYKYNGIDPGDIRHFIQQEYVDEILEYAKLHWYINIKDSYDEAIKARQIAKDWQIFEDNHAVTMMTLWYKPCDENEDDVCYSTYFEDVCKAYEEHEEEQTIEHNYSNAEMAEEIAAFERSLADERDINPWYTANDNDIAFETYEEMRRVDRIRQLAISAYNKGINTLTVIRFMREKLTNDAERGIFLEQYALAGFWDGYDSADC